jgi:hypothetical protein
MWNLRLGLQKQVGYCVEHTSNKTMRCASSNMAKEKSSQKILASQSAHSELTNVAIGRAKRIEPGVGAPGSTEI